MGKRAGNSVKDHIVKTASELFYRQGYNNTGINQIIEEAKVAKASLYSHFPSKEALAATYLRTRRKDWMGRLYDYVNEEDSLRGKVQRMFDFMAKKNLDDDYRGCAFINIMSEVTSQDKEIIEEVKAQKQTLLGFVRSLFESDEHYTKEEVEMKSKAVYLLFEGAIVEMQIHKDTWPVKAAKEAALDML